jgi:hypothetical protein
MALQKPPELLGIHISRQALALTVLALAEDKAQQSAQEISEPPLGDKPQVTTRIRCDSLRTLRDLAAAHQPTIS